VELFSITCTTCQQRLNVRDESAIGEIQICPKCGSMVLVDPPPDWQDAPAAEPSSAPSVQPPPIVRTKDKSGETASATSEAAPPPRQTPDAPPVAESSDQPPPDSQEPAPRDDTTEVDAEQLETQPDIEEEATSVPPDGPTPTADESAMSSDAPPTDPGEPVLPTDDWTSQATQQRRQWLLIAGAAVAGIVLAVGVFGFFVSRVSRPKPAEPVADVEEPRDTTEDADHDASEDGETADENGNETMTTTDGEDDEGTDDRDEPSEPHIDDASSKPESEPAEAPGPKVAESKPDTDKKTLSKSDKKDELILKPADDEPDATPMDTAALSKTLALLEPITNSQPDAAPAEESVAGLGLAALPLAGPSAPRPEPRKVDVAERLKDEIPGVEFTNVPLIDLVRFVTDFSTVPITFDPDALALMTVTPQKPVSVKLANTNVANLLSAALESLGLGCVPADGQLLITRPPLPDGKLRSLPHPVADLVGDDPEQLARLADLIVEMVKPDSWEAGGGVGVVRQQMPKLEFEHHEVGLFRAIVFCERLRAARGLPPQSNLNRESLKLESRLAQAKQQLATPITISFVQPTRFVRILDRLGKEAGLQILVDWRAVAELGWSPDGETTISANNEPIGQTLAKMLLPMDLTYRVINATTVQVTSPTALVSRLDVEFYPVDGLLSPQETPEAFAQRVRKELGEEGLRDVGAAVHLDAPSKHLIAALPQPWHRELAALLDQWKTKPAADAKDAPP